MRTKLLWGMALVVLLVVNYGIWEKERVLARGRTVLLELAPLDPSWQMQGHYMLLRYRLSEDIRAQLPSQFYGEGLAVVRLDGAGRAVFDHIHKTGEALRPDQALIRFVKGGESVFIQPDMFFFQEGQGNLYEAARWGELKVSPDGEAVLNGLRDAALLPLGPRLVQR